MKLKEVFVEPRNRTEFNVIVDEYHQSIKVKQEGAVFFAVCRGRVRALHITISQSAYQVVPDAG